DARHRRRLPRAMERSAAAFLLSQPVSRRVGGILAPRRSRCADRVRFYSWYSRHRIRRSLPPQHAGAPLGGDGGDGGGAVNRIVKRASSSVSPSPREAGRGWRAPISAFTRVFDALWARAG